MVVPFAAGGPVDVLGRIVGQYLGEALGKPVVIENVAGAGGMTGSQRVMQAAPDGYTFVLGSIGTHALNQTLYKRPLYNAATDFAPVALIADVPLVLITRKDLPANDLPQFISYAKANQAKMQFGSGGTGTSSHIGCVLLNQVIGVNLTHVPYRGGGPALVDLIGGRIDYLCNILSTAVEPIKAGQVKALAMLAPERSPVLPELKTAHEQGLDNVEAYTWNAIFLPKGTPPEIVGKLNAAVVKVMDNPAFQQKLDAARASRWSRRRDAAPNISASSSRARSTNGRARSAPAARSGSEAQYPAASAPRVRASAAPTKPCGVTRIELADPNGRVSCTLWPRARSAASTSAGWPRSASSIVGRPLMMDARRRHCLGDRQPTIDHVAHDLQHRGDDAAAAGRAGHQERLAVLEHDGRRHRGQRALAGAGRVGVAAEQAIGVGRARCGGEVVELVVEEDAGALGDEADAVAEIQRVGVGDRVAHAVDDGIMRRVLAFVRRLAGSVE